VVIIARSAACCVSVAGWVAPRRGAPLLLPLAEQGLGPLGPPGILVPDLAEELRQLLVACSLGVVYVLVVDLPTFGGWKSTLVRL
jgi:hypothetical protein